MRLNTSRQPTLNDVAARANVSRQTVSRVINNKGEISDATRERVLAVIQELGYQPNTLARSLVTSRNMVIGLSLPNIDQPYFPQIARGVEDAAAEAGYSVFLCNAASDIERELLAIERLRGHRVGGIISFNSRLDDAAVERAIGGLFPAVLVNRELPNARGTSIWAGYEAGARIATEHLIALGRKRIAFLGMDPDSHVDLDKQRGYESALGHAGITLDEPLMFRPSGRLGKGFNDRAQSGRIAIVDALTRGLKLDAIFATNDLPAIGAMHELLASGVRVPDDVAVVGFGGATVSGLVTPTLSTVTMPLYEIGAATFRTLLDAILDHSHEQRDVQIPPQLIVRESSCGGQDTDCPANVAVSRMEPAPR